MSLALEAPADYAMPTDEEWAHVRSELEPELLWSAGLHRYQTHVEILAAAADGMLREFTDTSDIVRVRGYDFPLPGTAWMRTPYLSPLAHTVALQFGVDWRDTLADVYDIEAPDERLCITSMTRSQAHQNRLVRSGRLAILNSTHATGYTFDIDRSGYYRMVHGELKPVIHPDRPTTDVPDRQPGYDYRLMDAAMHAAVALEKRGVINLVPEFQGGPNAVLHIAVNPYYNVENL